MALAPPEVELIRTLTIRTRLLSESQSARILKREQQPTRRAIKKLAEAGFIHFFFALARPELHTTAPVVTWSPGEPVPELSRAAYLLKSRWTEAPVRTRIIIASTASGRQFGGKGGRFPRGTEVTHDLHLAHVYLHFREFRRELAVRWISEEGIKAAREMQDEKVPDAMIQRSDGGCELIVECGGAYPKRKLTSFHEYCAERSLPYEVW